MTITATPQAATNNGHSTNEKPLTTPAVRFRQKRLDVNLYVTAISLRDLLGRFDSDTYSSDNQSGYQRPVTMSRLRKISHYVREEEGTQPTSIVLCVRQPNRARIESGQRSVRESGLRATQRTLTLRDNRLPDAWRCEHTPREHRRALTELAGR